MKLLIAVDGSKSALNAVKYALKLVQQMSAESCHVTLISVHDSTGLRHAAAFVGKVVVADYIRELSEKDLKAARKLLDAAGISSDVMVRTGHVSQEIVESAKSGKYDLIVLGFKGRSAVSDILLGSVAHRVLSKTKLPVLLVK